MQPAIMATNQNVCYKNMCFSRNNFFTIKWTHVSFTMRNWEKSTRTIFGDAFKVFCQLCTYFDMRWSKCLVLIGWKGCRHKGHNWQNPTYGCTWKLQILTNTAKGKEEGSWIVTLFEDQHYLIKVEICRLMEFLNWHCFVFTGKERQMLTWMETTEG